MIKHPEENIEQFNIADGAHVADIGAGSGHYSLALGKKLGPSNGKVFALDVQKELLDKLQNDAEQQGISNIEIIWGNAEKKNGTRLRDASVDDVILANVLFQIDDHDGIADEILRILKPGGRLFCIDWAESFGGLGPRADQIASAATAKELFTKHELTYEKDLDVGEHHYGIVFHK